MRRRHYLTEAVEDIIEISERGFASDLDDVVESLAGVVPDATVWVGETRHNRLDQIANIQTRILRVYILQNFIMIVANRPREFM